MVRKKEQERLRELLTEAMTVLCRGSLVYRHDFSIEGLLGITLDNQEIFLVNINEYVKKDEESPLISATNHASEKVSASGDEIMPQTSSPPCSPVPPSARNKSPGHRASRSSPTAKRRRISPDHLTVKEENFNENHHYSNLTDDFHESATPSSISPSRQTSSSHLPRSIASHSARSHRKEAPVKNEQASSEDRLPLPASQDTGEDHNTMGDSHVSMATKTTDYESLPGCSGWQDSSLDDTSTSARDADHADGSSSSSTTAAGHPVISVKTENENDDNGDQQDHQPGSHGQKTELEKVLDGIKREAPSPPSDKSNERTINSHVSPFKTFLHPIGTAIFPQMATQVIAAEGSPGTSSNISCTRRRRLLFDSMSDTESSPIYHPYVCTTCGRRYKTKCHLTEHSLTHTTLKYRCFQCGKQFPQARILNLHMQEHKT